MKKTIFSFAAALAIIISLNGCNFGENKKEKADEGSSSLNWTLEQFLVPENPVEIASDNTLTSTPADIQNLVSDFDIDIRNSLFLILQNAKNDDAYKQVSGKQSEYLFIMVGLLFSIYNDPAVANAMAKDYNDCIRSVGIDRLNKGEGKDCSKNWGRTWKSRVLDRLFSNSSLQNTLYEWLRPELLRMVNGFDDQQRNYMRNAINHIIDYTDNYNHQAEKDFYQKCCNSNYGEKLFVLPYRIVEMEPVESEGVVNPYRYLETWVYRRVEEGSMSAQQINNWLQKIKRDMSL